MSLHGVINLIKPPGMTSHDAVAYVRRVLKEKRVGHTGTLDPAAAGVLPICVGQATRLVESLQGGTKEYIAEATFGFETDSGDLLGEVVREAPLPQISLDEFRSAIEPFRGTIQQTPPMHSAIKVDGKKLYEIARAGGEVEIPVREVHISQLRVLSWNFDSTAKVSFLIECSGGTYIRSLIRDIGRQLGSAATMTFLMRTRSGCFKAEEGVTMESLPQSPQLVPFATAASWCAGAIFTSDEATTAMAQGKRYAAPTPNIMSMNEFSTNPREWKMHRISADQSGLDKNIVLVRNVSGSTFVLAHRTSEGTLQPDKVFNLEA